MPQQLHLQSVAVLRCFTCAYASGHLLRHYTEKLLLQSCFAWLFFHEVPSFTKFQLE